MNEELEPLIKFEWNFAEYFEENALHNLFTMTGPNGERLVMLMHELSNLTDDYIGMYLSYQKYAAGTIDLATTVAKLIIEEDDEFVAKRAANLVGFAVDSLRRCRFNFDHPGIHPNLRAGLNYGLHQFGRCLEFLLGYEVNGLNLLVTSASYGMDFKMNHPKLTEIMVKASNKQASMIELAYSKIPDPAKGKFDLMNPRKTKDYLQDTYNTLSKKHISSQTTYEVFEQIFDGPVFEAKVIWTGSMVSLRYFVEELVRQGIVKPLNDKEITTINCFYVTKLEVRSNEMAIHHLKKAAIPKDGSQPEIDKAIQHLL